MNLKQNKGFRTLDRAHYGHRDPGYSGSSGRT